MSARWSVAVCVCGIKQRCAEDLKVNWMSLCQSLSIAELTEVWNRAKIPHKVCCQLNQPSWSLTYWFEYVWGCVLRDTLAVDIVVSYCRYRPHVRLSTHPCGSRGSGGGGCGYGCGSAYVTDVLMCSWVDASWLQAVRWKCRLYWSSILSPEKKESEIGLSLCKR